MIYLSPRQPFSWIDFGDGGGGGGAAGRFERAEELTWPQFDERESKRSQWLLCPQHWKGTNGSLIFPRIPKRKNSFIQRWWIKQKEATRKGRGGGGGVFVRQRGNMRHVKSHRLFYLMGAAAVMHPCGPHFNNWTDIGAAPAGSPNHRHGFEQTTVTLRRQAWQRSAEEYRQRGRGRGGGGGGGEKKKRKKKKKDAFEAANTARGYRVMSTSPWRLPKIHHLKIVSCLNKS